MEGCFSLAKKDSELSSEICHIYSYYSIAIEIKPNMNLNLLYEKSAYNTYMSEKGAQKSTNLISDKNGQKLRFRFRFFSFLLCSIDI